MLLIALIWFQTLVTMTTFDMSSLMQGSPTTYITSLTRPRTYLARYSHPTNPNKSSISTNNLSVYH